MRRDTLLRLSGAAAAMGGALRIVDAFTVGAFDPRLLDMLYFANDVLLILGLIGWYLARADRLGLPGLAGFAVSVAAILVIRSAALFGAQGYALGAAALLVGLSVMDAPALLRRVRPWSPALFWPLSLGCAVLSPAAPALATLAGVLFGIGFVAAGIALWGRTDQPAQSAQTATSTVT